jgi:hypothetical protein
MSSILGKAVRRRRVAANSGTEDTASTGRVPTIRDAVGRDGSGRLVGAVTAVDDDPTRTRARWLVRGVVWAMLAVAIVVWVFAMRGTNLSQTGGLGLVNAFPTTYYIAVGICLAAIVLSLVWSPFSRLACASGLGVFILLIYGTPPVLYSEPQFAWLYKHLGVIDYLMTHGSTNRAIDIYQNWPGLFAGNALLAKASGVHPIDYAAWAPVFFDVALMAAVLFALGGVIANDRRRYAVALVWISGSWIGQDYLSPQAVSIVMVVAMLGIAVRIGTGGGWDAPARGRPGQLGDYLRRTLAAIIYWVVRRPPGSRDDGTPRIPRGTVSTRDRRVGMALMFVLGIAVITTHQLSPGNMLLDLGLVALFCGWRRLWPVIAALAVAEVAWVALAWPFVSRFGLVTIGGAVSPAVAAGVPLPGVAVVAGVSRAMGVAYWILAIAGVVRMLRRVGGDPATPAIFGALLLSPYLIVPVQSYGGEVSLRAYLFSLPWMSALAVEAIWPSGAPVVRRARASVRDDAAVSGARWGLAGIRRRPWGLALLTPILVAGTVVTYFGYALTNWMTPADVEAATWVETHLPKHSMVLFFSESFPNKLTARYPLITYYPLTLTDTQTNVFGMRTPGQRVATVRTALAAVGVQTVYLIVSPSMRNYDREEGVIGQRDIDATVQGLLAAPDIQTVYNHGGAYVFRYTVK